MSDTQERRGEIEWCSRCDRTFHRYFIHQATICRWTCVLGRMLISWRLVLALTCATLTFVFTAISFFMPYWSTKTTNEIILKNEVSAVFHYRAGVWGVCVDIDINASASTRELSTTRVDECYSFFAKNVFPDGHVHRESLCDAFEKKEQPFPLEFFQRDVFQDTCTGLGKWTLVFAALSMTLSLFMVIFLLLGLFYCKNYLKSAALVGLLAFSASMVAWPLWTKQDDEFNKGSTYLNFSFYFQVVASLLVPLTYLLLREHLESGKKDEGDLEMRCRHIQLTGIPPHDNPMNYA